jgi:serine protease Do
MRILFLKSRGVIQIGAVVAAWLGLAVCSAAPAGAEIYRYQVDGVWYYTDTPPAGLPDNAQVLPGSAGVTQLPPEGQQPLLADYPANNAIEKAAAGTVAVQSALGYGSGFFISSGGHIITNKHVIRTNHDQCDRAEDHFTQTEERIADVEKQFSREEKRLHNFNTRLKALKDAAQAETHPSRKQAYEQDYAENLKVYQDWQARLDQQRRLFETEKRQFRSNRHDYDYNRSVADLSQSFTITLVDNTQWYARLVAVSTRHDLALLKIDGCRVPSLTPSTGRRMIQGEAVYAIGNPVKLQNSVTSGIFSGYEQGFLQTNAQIYPGNSGGPLVNAAGEVVGINTFKQLTYKFEGLGFAIPIQTALEEFRTYLPTR